MRVSGCCICFTVDSVLLASEECDCWVAVLMALLTFCFGLQVLNSRNPSGQGKRAIELFKDGIGT